MTQLANKCKTDIEAYNGSRVGPDQEREKSQQVNAFQGQMSTTMARLQRSSQEIKDRMSEYRELATSSIVETQPSDAG